MANIPFLNNAYFAAKVGIGTDSPDAKFEVNSGGGIHLSDDTAGRTLIIKPSLSGAVHEFTSDNTAAGYAFSNSTSELMRIAANGNVGIGTTSPNAKLHIGPDSLVSGYTPDRSTLAISDTTNGGQLIIRGQSPRIWFDGTAGGNAELFLDDSKLNILSGRPGSQMGSSRLYIKADGNVGIGTTSPGQKLQVSGGNVIINGGSSNNLYLSVTSNYLYGDVNGVVMAGAGNNFRIKTNGSERVRVIANGNVGIGTTNPGTKLEVQDGSLSTIINSQLITARFRAQNSNASTLEIKDIRTDAGTSWTSSGKRLQMKIDTTYMGYIQFNGDSNNYGMSFGTGGTTSAPGNVSERMRIDQYGNVGIGTNNPSKKLEVNGTFRATGDASVDGTGNLFIRNRSATGSGIVFIDNAWQGGIEHNSGNLYFRTGGQVDRMTIKTNGNVGIGTTSPAKKLHVLNSTNEAQIRLSQSGSGSYDIGVYANDTFSIGRDADAQEFNIKNGNVGIGTISPSAKLDISTTGTGDSMIIRNNDASSSAAPVLMLLRDSASAASGDYLGQIKFKGNSDTGAERVYAKVTAKISDATNGAEDSLIETAVRNNGANIIVSRQTNTDLKLINGVGLEVDGDVQFGAYGAGTLITDANGNVSVSSGGGAGGPYLPLSAGSTKPLTGNLYINDTIPKLIFTDTNTSTIASISANSSNLTYTTVSTARDHTFKGGTSTLMTIEGTGNVGIGITSPTTKLDVVGEGAALGTTGYYYNARFKDSSNVGVLIGHDNTPNGNGMIAGINKLAFVTYGTDWEERMVIDGSGNVGIGTTSPSRLLHVHAATGNAYLQLTQAATGTTSNDGFQIAVGAVQVNFINRENGSMVFETNNTEKMRITNAGNVGIGTTAPEGILQISKPSSTVYDGTSDSGQSNIGASVTIQNTNTTVNSFAQINMQVSASSNRAVGRIVTVARGNASSDMAFVTESFGVRAEKMRIDQTGNVGIGTTNPSDELHVEGVIQSKNYLLPSTSGTAGWYKIGTLEGFVQGGATAVIEIAGHQGYNATNNQDYLIKLFIKTSNGGSVGPDGQKYNSWYERTGGNASTDIQFKWDNSATNDYHLYMYIPTHSLRSWYSVKKGTGTWDHVGTSATDPGANSATVLKATGLFNILDTNVGIGTTSPSKKLDIAGDLKLTNSNSIYWRNAADNADIPLLNLSSNNTFNIGTTSSSVPVQMALHTAGSERIRITSTGNVGIGTSSPTKKLHVAGDTLIEASGTGQTLLLERSNGQPTIKAGATNNGHLILDSNAGHIYLNNYVNKNIYMVNGGGNVGIGTTNPVYKLDVNGITRAGGVVTYSKYAGSLTTTGYAVAGLTSSSNGSSTGFTFTCFGYTGGYQKIVYSCRNETGVWKTSKVINEGTNDFDVEASADGTTITFTFKSTSGTKYYSPRVTIEATGHSINSTYA